MRDLLRTLFVVPSARLQGGGDRWLDCLLSGLGGYGIAVTVLFEEGGELADRARSHGCRAIVASGSRRRTPQDLEALVVPVAEVISTYQPRVTVFWSPRAQVYGARAHEQAGRPGRTSWVQHVLPSEFWLHQVASESPSDLVVCVSGAVRQRQERLFPGCPARVIHPGIDMPSVMPRETARQALAVPSETPAIGLVGRIEPWKGQDVALRALAAMRDTTCRLVLVGDTHSATWPEFAPKVRALAADLGIAGRVIATGHRQDATALLSGLDVLLCASREEGFGLAIVEAMAAGVPVVATRCGGPEDIIVDGETGVMVPAEDPDALAQAAEAILASPEAASRIADKARSRYRKLFTSDHGAARFAEVLHGLAQDVLA